jgi:hypothetical protein
MPWSAACLAYGRDLRLNSLQCELVSTALFGLLLEGRQGVRVFDDCLQEILHADDHGLGFALFGDDKALAVARDPFHNLPELRPGDKGRNTLGHQGNVLLWHDYPSANERKKKLIN